MTSKRRWPKWVYSGGKEPDYRFSLANERTFLAWIRTSLALLAAGVAVDVVDLDIAPVVRGILGGLLVVLGAMSAAVAWVRWAAAERAIRRRDPLPSFGWAVLLAVGLVIASVVILVVGY